jgi:hypothetical protein
MEWFDTAVGLTDYYEVTVTNTAQDIYIDQGSQFSVFRTS